MHHLIRSSFVPPAPVNLLLVGAEAGILGWFGIYFPVCFCWLPFRTAPSQHPTGNVYGEAAAEAWSLESHRTKGHPNDLAGDGEGTLPVKERELRENGQEPFPRVGFPPPIILETWRWVELVLPEFPSQFAPEI